MNRAEISKIIKKYSEFMDLLKENYGKITERKYGLNLPPVQNFFSYLYEISLNT
jgi:hypothetical protein